METEYKELEKKLKVKYEKDRKLLEKRNYDKMLQKKLSREYDSLFNKMYEIEKKLKPVRVEGFTRIRNGKKEKVRPFRRRLPNR